LNILTCKAVAAAVLPMLVAIGAATAQAPQKNQEELVKLRDEKFALPVFTKADWTFDYDKARERAAKEGKLIFSYFSRSYAA